jgi:ribonuclease Z
MAGLEEAYALDIKIRCEDERVPLDGITTDVSEFQGDGVVYEHDDVRVIAFEVDHGDAIKPAYGYRIEHKGRACVLSGDTRYHPNVVRYGKGADLLVHEVGAARPGLLDAEPDLRRIFAHHTSPREAGQVFSLTRPRMAAYTHLVLLANETIAPPTIEDLVAETRQVYDGPLVVGEDLMAFDIGDTVTVRQRGL